MKKTPKKRREFSKIMAIIAITMWIFVNLFGMAMVIFTLDTSPLMYVIPSVDAVVAIVLGHYYWKAKAENQIKLKKLYDTEVGCEPDEEMYTRPATNDRPLYENSNIV